MVENPGNNDQHLENDDDQAIIDKLDAVIAEKAPEFQSEVESINEIAEENLNIELVDLDQLLAQDKAKSFRAKWKRLKHSMNTQFFKLSQFLKWIAVTFVKETIPSVIVKTKSIVLSMKKKILEKIIHFKGFTRSKKIFSGVIFFGVLGFFYYLSLVIKDQFLIDKEKLFIYSMEELSEKKYFFEKNEMEDFYNSSRVDQNLVTLKRIVINLRKSRNSGDNPMGAFEFFLQGNSNEVMIEIKDREAEVVDLFQLELKGFSYDDLDSVEGKNKMSEALKNAINKILIKGSITRVFFKNFVLKR